MLESIIIITDQSLSQKNNQTLLGSWFTDSDDELNLLLLVETVRRSWLRIPTPIERWLLLLDVSLVDS